MIRKQKKWAMLAMAVFLTVGVASCGVKPKSLSSPEGAEDSSFPDLKHDPKPEE